MRVLHIATEMSWRGGENQLRLLLEGLAATEVECHLAARPGSAAAHRLQSRAQLVELPMRGGFDPLAARRLVAYCRDHRIELLDAHTSKAHALALLVKLGLPHLRLVVHRRVDDPPSANLMSRLKYLSPKVDRYVAISEAIARVLVDYGVPAARITVVRSAVPTEAYRGLDKAGAKAELAAAYGVNRNLTFFGNASALSHQKGYETLLLAAARLRDQGVPFHCFIAGDGEQRASLERQRQELGLGSHVTFLGFIEGVPRFLAALDILAVPSRNEGLGTIILDGTAAGCAVAATRVGGIPEVIRHGETGLLSEREDAEALARHLATLIESPNLRAALNQKAQALIARDFSIGAMVGGNLGVYRELLRSS